MYSYQEPPRISACVQSLQGQCSHNGGPHLLRALKAQCFSLGVEEVASLMQPANNSLWNDYIQGRKANKTTSIRSQIFGKSSVEMKTEDVPSTQVWKEPYQSTSYTGTATSVRYHWASKHSLTFLVLYTSVAWHKQSCLILRLPSFLVGNIKPF